MAELYAESLNPQCPLGSTLVASPTDMFRSGGGAANFPLVQYDSPLPGPRWSIGQRRSLVVAMRPRSSPVWVTIDRTQSEQQRGTTNWRRTTSHSFSLHPYAYGCAPMSPR